MSFSRPFWLVVLLALTAPAFSAVAADEVRDSADKAQEGDATSHFLKGIKGHDDRERADITQYPWRTIGRLNRDGSYCTGILIGPAKVLTASHCFWDARRQDWAIAGAFHFVVEYERGNFGGHSRVKSYILSKGASRKDPRRAPLELDWAIATLEEPLGEEFGYMSLSDLTVAEVGDALQGASTVVQAGFSRDIPHMLTIHSGCQITGIRRNSQNKGTILLHQCDATSGDSGSPIFLRQGEDYSLLGIHVATVSRSGEGMLGVAIAADTFRRAVEYGHSGKK